MLQVGLAVQVCIGVVYKSSSQLVPYSLHSALLFDQSDMGYSARRTLYRVPFGTQGYCITLHVVRYGRLREVSGMPLSLAGNHSVEFPVD